MDHVSHPLIRCEHLNSFCIIFGVPKAQCPDACNHYGRRISHLEEIIFSDGVAPSFEQIGIAVQSVIAEASEADSSCPNDKAKDMVLSSEYQLIMTWCWLNIRVNSTVSSCCITLNIVKE